MIPGFEPVTLADETRFDDSPALVDENREQKTEVAQQVEKTGNFRRNFPHLFFHAHETA